MRIHAICFLGGVCSLALLHDITRIDWRWPLACCLCVLPVVLRRRGGGRVPGLLLSLLAGLAWAGHEAGHTLSCRLPERLAGTDMVVQGRIASLPRHGDTASRFAFEVDHTATASTLSGLVCPPRRLLLNWYDPPAFSAGERWRLVLRLKPPHGFANPGGFDYERWLLRRGMHATGYVRTDTRNAKLAPSPPAVDSARTALNSHIANALGHSRFTGILQALATGTRARISQRDWDVLLRTGTNHLMAISGLHIGLAAGLGYLLVLHACRLLAPARVLTRLPAQDAAAVASLLTAAFYAALAGLGVPTQRALIMLACFVFAWVLRRRSHPLDTLALALVIVLLCHPMSVHDAGFWFSFIAVLIIIAAARAGLATRPRWQQVAGIQLVLSAGLAPLSLLMFQQASLVAPLANLVLVPYVSLLVVPVTLVAVLLLPLSADLSALLLVLADSLFAVVWPLLDVLAAQPHAVTRLAARTLWQAVLAVAVPATAILVYRRHDAVRAATVLLLGGVVMWLSRQPGIEHGDYLLDVLDVGQGTAVVVRTREHTLVYDTGDKLGDRLDAGRAVVVPFLRSHGIARVDTLVISHGDSDHIGGATSVLAGLEVGRVLGRDIAPLEHRYKHACERGMRWNWDGVEFEMLHPRAHARARASNNLSCVLRIAGGGITLLTGDIESRVESDLLRSHATAKLDADILLVPHHGSKTSSTSAFIAAVSPDHAVFTAGYRNRYRLPLASIVERYRLAGSEVSITGRSGAIHFAVRQGSGVAPPVRYRRAHPGYWRHRPVENPYAKTGYGAPVKSSMIGGQQAHRGGSLSPLRPVRNLRE